MEERQRMKKDLEMVLRLNNTLDYDNREDVEKNYNRILQERLFQTSLGERYTKKLEKIVYGAAPPQNCIFCKGIRDNASVICDKCRTFYGRQIHLEKESVSAQYGGKAAVEEKPDKAPAVVEIDAEQLAALSKQAAEAFRGSLDTFTSKINEMAGGSGAVDLKLRDLFSGVFKKHTRAESEEIFIAGTLKTTPAESEIAVSWPKPWLFSRVWLALLVSYSLLYICSAQFYNANTLPGLMFIGALVMPFSVLIFLFETNAPRNISIFEVVKMFFVGGAASLVLTLFLFTIFPVGELDYIGAFIVGVVEETGKLLAIILFVKALKPKYILNGMLIGASVGAGFAVFETAGYAFRQFEAGVAWGFDKGIDRMAEVLFLRGWSSLGGHVAWAAVTGAGLVLVKGAGSLTKSNLTNRRVQKFFLIPVILHGIWDCPFMGGSMEYACIKMAVLIVTIWIVILVLLHAGLKQIERICADGEQTAEIRNKN